MKRTQTDLQVTHSCRLAMLGQAWCAMDDFAKSSWITLFNNTPPNPGSPHATPYLTFIAANIGIYAATSTILYHAPPHPIAPCPITEGCLEAAHTQNTFALTLTLPASYPDCLLIYAAAPVPFAQDAFAQPQRFRLVGALANPACENDLTAFYQARFRTRGAGSKVCVKLVGVSASGERTDEYRLSALVNAHT